MVLSLPMSDYDTDVYAWSKRQSALLRRLAAGERVNDADLDWPNIAEEIETVGRSERGAVASHITNIIHPQTICVPVGSRLSGVRVSGSRVYSMTVQA